MISRGQVLDAAAVALAIDGAEGVSLRSIARRLGVVSSALYRHYPSRDALLADLALRVRLALDEYVERAEASVARADVAERLAAIVRSTMDWAKRNPHEYALAYGDQDWGPSITDTAQVSAPDGSPASLVLIEGLLEEEGASQHRPSDAAVRVWSQLFGHVWFELFGHYEGAVGDIDVYTEALIAAMAADLGLPPGSPTSSPSE
ncbi:TetR/AcrR family transcriptional regulator [Humibacter antri]